MLFYISGDFPTQRLYFFDVKLCDKSSITNSFSMKDYTFVNRKYVYKENEAETRQNQQTFKKHGQAELQIITCKNSFYW